MPALLAGVLAFGFHVGMSVDVKESLESRVLSEKREFDDSGRAVTLLGNDQFRQSLVFLSGFINLFPVNKHDKVGILLDRSGFTQVGQLWFVIALPLFGRAAQLRQRNDGH